ncbi:hypothetical protein F751_6459 [Auxenochlorella protothecoides]|uniref:Uncharacterized protein n=1 Tax=Auxenochlorella protothecoides TaxID=3075 RepID=A0A087SB46_AUXPR|nr:hypothetical protein F751_6459 [Auxenochlorella protothecoides]KFM22950.1 hypothetical protein F751_6459 [Auxenochlorella protothecoides]
MRLLPSLAARNLVSLAPPFLLAGLQPQLPQHVLAARPLCLAQLLLDHRVRLGHQQQVGVQVGVVRLQQLDERGRQRRQLPREEGEGVAVGRQPPCSSHPGGARRGAQLESWRRKCEGSRNLCARS